MLTEPPPEPVAKRAKRSRLVAPGAFTLDLRKGCICCGSLWCADTATLLPPKVTPTCRPEVLALRQQTVADRRHLHQHPEVAFQEHATAKYCADRLRSLGLEVQEGLSDSTGVAAMLKGGAGPGPCIALRADMDALPIHEEAPEGQDELPFCSKNPGVMHACGHDAHMATLLCAAEVLTSHKSRLRGSVKFIFQHAEENGDAERPHGGAHELVHRSHILDGVEQIFGLHVWSYAPVGVIGASSGCVMASCDTVEIAIEGQGGHGAAPAGTVDAVLVMGHMITALHSIVSRNFDPSTSAVLTIGAAEAGNAPNVIAARAKLKATVRCLDGDVQKTMKKRIQEVCTGVAATFGAQVHVKYTEEAPSLINSDDAAELVKKAAGCIVPPDCIKHVTTMASEDFAFYLEGAASFPAVTVRGVPGCFFFIGAAPKAEVAGSRPHHNPAFTIDEDAMLIGASIFVQLIHDILGGSQ